MTEAARSALSEVNGIKRTAPSSAKKPIQRGFGSSTSRFSDVGSIYGSPMKSRSGDGGTPSKAPSSASRAPRSSSKRPTSAVNISTKGRFEEPGSIYSFSGEGAQPPTAEECPEKNEWSHDDPNYCLQSCGKGVTAMKKPKRSRFSDAFSIHATRKTRERLGDKAIQEVGLSAEEGLKGTKDTKGGGYVPSKKSSIAEGDKETEEEEADSDQVSEMGVFERSKRSKHGRFSSVGCIYK